MESKWFSAIHAVAWAERITVQRATGRSPFAMVHGVEPLTPWDLSEATYMLPPQDAPMSSADLLAARARALQMRAADLNDIHDRVLRARFASVKQFEEKYQNSIIDYDFQPGALVLYRNSRIEMELNRKSKPRYLGPMVVVRRTVGGSYILAELDGAMSKTRFSASRVIPYHARSSISIPVTDLVEVSDDELDVMMREQDSEGSDDFPEVESDPDDTDP